MISTTVAALDYGNGRRDGFWSNALALLLDRQLLADTVEKVENRSTQKYSRIAEFCLIRRCTPL
jgi:hypothetical protein